MWTKISIFIELFLNFPEIFTTYEAYLKEKLTQIFNK